MTPGEWEIHGGTIATFTRLGLRLAPEDAVDTVSAILDRVELVVLTFPKFNDGRGFSQARLLRDRFGFTGEIRATGHVLRDQFGFLRRSGVNAVEVDDAGLADAWNREGNRFAGHYQPAFGDRRAGLRVPANRQAIGIAGEPGTSNADLAASWAY